MMTPRVATVACALLSAGLTACGDPQPLAPRSAAEHVLPTVRVQAERLPAYVRSIEVREGERIRRGQVLVQLDARDQEAAVRRA